MEKKVNIFPITEENFSEAWDWVDEHRRKALVRKWVRRISGGVGNLVFFLLMCILMYGYYRQAEGVYFQAFLRTFPVFPQIWDWLLANILKPELGIWGQIGVLAAMLYLICFTVEAICSIIVRLCCRPKAKAVPEGTPRETAEMLLTETKKLIMSKQIRYVPSSNWYSMLFLLLSAGVLAAFTLVTAMDGNDAVIMQLTMKLASPAFLLLVLFCWLGYALIDTPLLQLTRLLYVLKLPTDLLDQVQSYYLQQDPEKKAQLEEEERILALAEQIKLRRAKEKEALTEKKHKRRK